MRYGACSAGSGIALAVIATVGVAGALAHRGDTDVPVAPDATSSGRDVATASAGCGDSARPGRGAKRRPDPEGDLIAGPLVLIGLGGYWADKSEYFVRSPGQRHTRVKAPALVKRGEAVTVAVAQSDRPNVKLGYAGTGSHFAVRLKACRRGGPEPRRTRFASFLGGFKVRGPLCTTLLIRIHGREGPPLERTV
jgi:hypothetical protein